MANSLGHGLGRHHRVGRWARLRHAWPVELAVQVTLVLGAALLYFAVRGVTEGSTADAIHNGYRVLHLEHTLGIAAEQTVQNAVLGSRVLTTFANWVYIWGHWPVIIVTLVWLHRSHRRGFVLLRNAMFISGAIGLVFFAFYPVAPPRHLPDGFVDTVTELSRSYRVLQPPSLVNEYAAVPSLHVGWNLLVGVFLVRHGRSAVVRGLGVASPLMMTFAVVATGNHYVVDAITGAGVALVGLAGSHLVWRSVYARFATGGQAGDQVEGVDVQARCAPRDHTLDVVVVEPTDEPQIVSPQPFDPPRVKPARVHDHAAGPPR
jgi:hypothetical protein